MVTVKDWEHIASGRYLNENPQESRLRFSHAFAKKDDETIYRSMCFVKCRDFFNDHFAVLQGQRDEVGIYNFFTVAKRPTGFNKDYLLVSYPDHHRVNELVSIVNNKFKEYGLGKIKIIEHQSECEESGSHDFYALKSYVVIDTPSYWWKSGFNLNLLTYLLRYEDTGGNASNDEIKDAMEYYVGIKDPYLFLRIIKKLPSLRGKSNSFPGTIGKDIDDHSLHNAGLCFFFRSIGSIKAGRKPTAHEEISKILFDGVKVNDSNIL